MSTEINESLCFIFGANLWTELNENYSIEDIYKIITAIEDEFLNDTRYTRVIAARDVIDKLNRSHWSVKRYGEDGEIIDMDILATIEAFKINANYDFRSIFMVDMYGSIITSTGSGYKFESTVSKGYIAPRARFRILERTGVTDTPSFHAAFATYIGYLNNVIRKEDK